MPTGDNAETDSRARLHRGRIITSGALIMVAVFLSFVTDPSPFALLSDIHANLPALEAVLG